jgi:predicted nucleic acid-binding protein
MTEFFPTGLLDTSVVIDLSTVATESLPPNSVTTAVTIAELSAGPLTTSDPAERARRIARLHWAQASLEALPFDAEAARYYGALCSLVVAAGRHPRRRIADIMIASISAVHGLPLFTRNPDDFKGLETLVTIISV